MGEAAFRSDAKLFEESTESQATTDLLPVTIDSFSFYRIVYKWNAVYALFVWLLSLNKIILIFISVDVYKNSSFFLCVCGFGEC